MKKAKEKREMTLRAKVRENVGNIILTLVLGGILAIISPLLGLVFASIGFVVLALKVTAEEQ